MKRELVTLVCVILIVAAVCLIAQREPPPPVIPPEQAFATIISNTVRSCVEEYTRQYVRVYTKAFVAEISNQLAGTRSLAVLENRPLTNTTPAMPQPCEHVWIPLLRYQQEHFCSRCGAKEWK